MNSLSESYPSFHRHPLDDHCALWIGRLPDEIEIAFEPLWNQHPSEYHEIITLGRGVKTPRWQRALGRTSPVSRLSKPGRNGFVDFQTIERAVVVVPSETSFR